MNKIVSIMFRDPIWAYDSDAPKRAWAAREGASAVRMEGGLALSHTSRPGATVFVPMSNVLYFETRPTPEPQHLPEPTKAAGGKKGARKTDPQRT